MNIGGMMIAAKQVSQQSVNGDKLPNRLKTICELHVHCVQTVTRLLSASFEFGVVCFYCLRLVC